VSRVEDLVHQENNKSEEGEGKNQFDHESITFNNYFINQENEGSRLLDEKNEVNRSSLLQLKPSLNEMIKSRSASNQMIDPLSLPPVLNLTQLTGKRIRHSNEMSNDTKYSPNNNPTEEENILKKKRISKNNGGKMTKKNRNKSK
jgi:hypothetical protein